MRSISRSLRQHRHAVEVGHDEVEDDERDAVASGAVEAGRAPPRRRRRAIAAWPNRSTAAREQPALDRIVVDDEDGGRHLVVRLRPVAAPNRPRCIGAAQLIARCNPAGRCRQPNSGIAAASVVGLHVRNCRCGAARRSRPQFGWLIARPLPAHAGTIVPMPDGACRPPARAVTAAAAADPHRRRARRPAGMEPRRPLRRHGRPALKRDLARAESRVGRLRDALQGQARRRWPAAPDGGKRLAEAVVAFEALEELLGRIVSFAGLRPCRRHQRSGALEVLRRRAGEDHRGELASPVLPARAEPHRRRRARHGADAIRRSATTGRGSRTSARRSPTSSRTASSSSSTRSR